MAFTNTWDTAFPPDTQLANLLGQDIRNGVKVDVQQRMAAISGLDAAKPTFGSDAQPANWNGILFFATDTGSIYQFNNPTWTNVTSNFTATSRALKAVNQVIHTGTTTQDVIYTLTVPGNILGTTGRLRITINFLINSLGGSTNIMKIAFGAGNSVFNFTAANYNGATTKVVIEGGNTGATNAQRFDGLIFAINGGGVSSIGSWNVGFNPAMDTTVNQNIVFNWQNGLNTDQQTFDSMTIEIF